MVEPLRTPDAIKEALRALKPVKFKVVTSD